MADRKMVHIVDDEEAIRKSTGFMLRVSGFAVETWPSGTAFLKDVRNAEPGCILLDVRMPDVDGLTVQQTLAEVGVSWPVVVMTGHGDISIAVRAMKQGAMDFIEKPFDKEALLGALDAAFARLRDDGARHDQASMAQVRIAALTEREREVLDGLARGLPNKTIAYDLGISPRTVEVHRANVMSKLDVRSFSDALRVAFAAGLGLGG